MLICGIGGIGCELLNLVINKTKLKITICDYDKIEITNLNRSCLFDFSDIDEYKVLVAQKKIKNKFGIDISIINDKIENINKNRLKNFEIIVMCLDNINSRRYLNKILFENNSNFILFDTGSEGFNSHLKIIRPFLDPCVDCNLNFYKNDENINLCTIKNIPRNIDDCILFYKDSKEDNLLELIRNRAIKFKIDYSKLDNYYIDKILNNIIITFQSTNKMISSLVVKEIIKLENNKNDIKFNYLLIYNELGFTLKKLNLERNLNCIICSKNIITIKRKNINNIEDLLKNFDDKKITFLDINNDIIYTNNILIKNDYNINEIKNVIIQNDKYLLNFE